MQIDWFDSQVDEVRGLHLRGWELDGAGCAALAGLKLLQLARLECSFRLQELCTVLSRLPSLRWLMLRGSTIPPAGSPNTTTLELQASIGGGHDLDGSLLCRWYHTYCNVLSAHTPCMF
jgi:uncharacterized protein YodC (DUF2158 family)